MEHNKQYDIIGDGTLYSNGIMGLISCSQFLEEELPAPSFVYILYHPRKRKHTWVLERLTERTEIPQPKDEYGFGSNDEPAVFFVCFAIEPEFDYHSFDEDDYDTYIEWENGKTMQDIILGSVEGVDE